MIITTKSVVLFSNMNKYNLCKFLKDKDFYITSCVDSNHLFICSKVGDKFIKQKFYIYDSSYFIKVVPLGIQSLEQHKILYQLVLE